MLLFFRPPLDSLRCDILAERQPAGSRRETNELLQSFVPEVVQLNGKVDLLPNRVIMPNIGTYFDDFFNGDAPADDYYIVFGLIGGLMLLCWTACCIYFCVDFGSARVRHKCLRQVV